MNKKVLSAILFSALFAGTGTFTSCIDNDEPAGIEELRGAKAELLRAKVAVEQAEATYKLALAEVQKAEAAIKNAEAELKKALVEEQELKNERLSITNADAQADLDAKIAEAALKAEKAKLEHEIAMTKLNEQLASAKRNYELFLAHLEIAKATLADKDVVTLFELETEVEDAQDLVETAEANVKTAEDDYYWATLEVNRGEVSMKRYETKVANAEDALATAQATYEKWNSLLESENETADWTAEISSLEDSIKGLEKKQVELEVELAKLKNSEDFKKLIDAENAANYAFDNHKTAEKYTFTDAMNHKLEIAKGTPAVAAIEKIGGSKWDGKENSWILSLNNRIASYTTEKIAVLELIKGDYDTALANAKKASDDATAAWTAAKTAYANAKANAKDISTAAAETAVETYVEDLEEAEAMPNGTDEEKYKRYGAILKAKQVFADALVAWYNTLPADQASLNKLTLIVETTINGITKEEYVTKTAKEWLSDTNKEIYLDIITNQLFKNSAGPDYEAFYRVGAKREITDAAGTKYETAWSALGSLKSKATLIAEKKTDVQAKSAAAFGKELLVGHDLEEGYMQVVPTDDEVLAVEDYDTTCGALGKYVWMKQESTQYEARNYEAIIAKYEEAVTYWTEVMNTLIAEHKALEEAAYAAWLAKYTYEVENFEAINREINGEIGGRIAALTRVKDALTKAVVAYLQVDYANFDGSVKFEAWLKKQAAIALNTVYSKEDELIQAQNALTAAKDGKVDVWAQLTAAEEALAEAMAELTEAQTELETALANLKKGLDIIAALNAAE